MSATPPRPSRRARAALRSGPAALALAALSACAAQPKVFDYTVFLEHTPRSILVLPPLDETPETDACYGYLSTVTYALAEQGYYVFPVALVDRMLRENGLPTAGEMHQAPLAKLREVFGADAVLYLTVDAWGTSFQVFDSVTSVGVSGRLVDLESGAELWHGQAAAAQGSSSGQSSLAGLLVSAIVNQVATSASDPSPQVARGVNERLFADADQGLLLGPYHPKQAADLQARRAALAKGAASAAPAPSTPGTP